jgi:hypothetical protein
VKVIDKVKYYWGRFLANAPGWKAAVVSTLNSLIGFGVGLSALVAGLSQIQVNGEPLIDVPAGVIAGLTLALSLLRTLVAAINPFDPTFGLGSNHTNGGGGVDQTAEEDTPPIVVVDDGGVDVPKPIDPVEVEEPDAEVDGPELVLEDVPDDAVTENDVDLRLS